MTVQREPNSHTIGGRLKIERVRLGLSQPALGTLADMTKGAVQQWESGKTFPTANVLAVFGEAGADVLFIMTGRHEAAPPPSPEGLPGVTVRQALAMLDPVDRHRLLLDLIAEEMRG